MSPRATTSSTHVSFVNHSVSAGGSAAVAMMSRSRNVSLRRRTDPASETRSASDELRIVSTTASTAGRPWPSSGRIGSAVAASSIAFRTRSSSFAPTPPSVRRRCCSAASFSSTSVVTPSSFQMRAAVFGPRPGRRRKRTTSGGIWARRFVSAWISPSSTIWTIFSSIVLPMPPSSFALPSTASSAIDPEVSRTRLAARR